MKTIQKKFEKNDQDKQTLKLAKAKPANTLSDFELGWQNALTELNAFLNNAKPAYAN